MKKQMRRSFLHRSLKRLKLPIDSIALAMVRHLVVEDTVKPGFHLGRHHHKQMTEIFYILEGEIELILDDKIVVASAGTTINIPQNVWHEAKSANGAKMLSIFSPAGFEDYLAEMKTLANEQFADEPFMRALNEKYDIWNE
jgi:mannose-6-phosphate isomerase-like protein (cupin superfamily)